MNKITDKNENTKKESEDDSQNHPKRASKNQLCCTMKFAYTAS